MSKHQSLSPRQASVCQSFVFLSESHREKYDLQNKRARGQHFIIDPFQHDQLLLWVTGGVFDYIPQVLLTTLDCSIVMFTPEKSIGNSHKPPIHHSQANKYVCACWILMIVSRFRTLAVQPDNFLSIPVRARKEKNTSTALPGSEPLILVSWREFVTQRNIHTWLYSERAAFTNTSQTCSPDALQKIPLRFLSSLSFSVFCFSPWSCVCGFSPQITFGTGTTYGPLLVPHINLP